MRLNSTGLGIGTSSPNYSLTSYKSGAVANYIQVASGATGAGSGNGLLLGVDSSGNSVINAQGSVSLLTTVAGVLRTTLDSSGNLGLGVTPSAWAGSKSISLSASGAVYGDGVGYDYTAGISQNAYRGNSTQWNYRITGVGAARFDLKDNTFAWYNAGSGTAGNAITFTQAMTLDASGNLLVGTTTAVSKVTSSAGAADGSIGYAGSFHANQGAGGDSYIQLGGNRSSGLASGAVSIINAKNSFGNGQLCLYTEGTERARIDSSGNFGIGLTSPQTALDVNGVITVRDGTLTGSGRVEISSTAFVGLTMASGNYVFKNATNTSEYARIDSSGNLLVGVTSTMNGVGSDGKIGLQLSGASGNFVVQNSGDDNIYLAKISGYSNSTFIRLSVNGTGVGSVTTNGTITFYNTTSDYRLKTVVGAVTGHGERIDALEPVEYTWNSNGSRTRGFLAHKFQKVYADSVTGSKDAVDANGKPVYQSMQAATSEVIADLVAEIQSLRKRLADAGIA